MSGAGAAQADDDLAKVKSVAVISAIGDCVELYSADQLGGLFSMMDRQCLPSADWQLDEAVTKQIADAVGGRFKVKRVKYDRATFSRIPRSLIPDQEAPIERPLQSVSNPGVDAYFVVTKSELADDTGNSASTREGLGLAHQNAGMFNARSTTMYAAYTIRVVNARTLETLETEGAHLPESGLLPRIAEIDVDNDLWSSRVERLTADQKAQIKTKMAALVHDSIAATLQSMNLAP